MSAFGWSLPAGCGTLPGEEDEQLDNRVFAEAFANYSGPAKLAESYKKYNACGPSVGVIVELWEEQDDCYPLKRTKSLFGDYLDTLGTWADMDTAGVLVTGFIVGSIVEGVDYDCDTITVLIDQLEEDAEAILSRVNDAVAKVCEQAQEIWNDTHGCPTCEELGGTDEFGQTPVHPGCPDCGGFGIVI